MAGGAVAAEAAFVALGAVVVSSVAIDAGRADLVLVQVPAVAIGALGAAVLAAQGVLGVGVVVEGRRLPGLGAVTGVAAFAVEAFVALGAVVVSSVAADAGARRVLVLGALLVAIAALGVSVFVFQREAGLVVVELGLLPVDVGVAVGTLRTQRALVHVVLAMAGVAIGRCLPVFLFRLVAFFALDLEMLAAQRVVGLRVIELGLVEFDDARCAAPVVGMATAAGLRLVAAVKTRALTHVLPHFLVAIHAQPVLRRTVEAQMAFRAIVFPLGVALDQVARPQHRLDVLRPGAGHRANAETGGQCGRSEPESKGREPRCQSRPQYACTAITCTMALMISR